MRTKYETDPDLRAVFESGLRAPENGGLYYARKAYFDCAAFLHEAHGERKDGSTDAIENALKRCNGIGDAASEQRLNGTIRTALAYTDPLYRIVNDAQDAGVKGHFSLEAAKTAINNAIDLGDPYVLATVLYRTALVAKTFDGQAVDFSMQQQLISATSLAMCQLGADCDNSATVVLSCARESGCARSLYDVVLNDSFKTPEDRETILRIADKISKGASSGSLADLWG